MVSPRGHDPVSLESASAFFSGLQYLLTREVLNGLEGFSFGGESIPVEPIQ